MKFVHAADIHLDSPLRGLERYDGAPVETIRQAPRSALENLVELCLAEQVDLLLLAGDLFDGEWKDYNTGLFFTRQMARLREAGIPVVSIRGNHDAASHLTSQLRWPDNVIELSSRKAETRVFEPLGIAVHGQSYAKRDTTHDLTVHYPAPLPDCLNIGLLHTALNGRAGHEPYAPCSVSTLVNKGYDYWALGHVHGREVLSENPWIVFPGNLQGRHSRETGAKGATLVTVTDGVITHVEQRPLDVVRWAVCELDVTDVADADTIVEQAREALAVAADSADGRLLAARVQLGGVTPAHRHLTAAADRWREQIRAAALELNAEVWVEKVQLDTRAPLDLDALLQHDDPVAELVRTLRTLRDEPAELAELADAFAELRQKLPHDYRQLEDALHFDEPATLARLLDDVEQLLLRRLLDAREES